MHSFYRGSVQISSFKYYRISSLLLHRRLLKLSSSETTHIYPLILVRVHQRLRQRVPSLPRGLIRVPSSSQPSGWGSPEALSKAGGLLRSSWLSAGSRRRSGLFSPGGWTLWLVSRALPVPPEPPHTVTSGFQQNKYSKGRRGRSGSVPQHDLGSDGSVLTMTLGVMHHHCYLSVVHTD